MPANTFEINPIFILLILMDKQKLSELVLAKIKEKRDEEERNRPHYEVLRLEAVMAREKNKALKDQIQSLQSTLQQSTNLLANLQTFEQELDNTGKKYFPRIVVKPQFIATQKVESKIKEFFRKSANSFLRLEILRKKDYESSLINEQHFIESSKQVGQLQKTLAKRREEDVLNVNRKRAAILQQQIRLKQLLKEQQEMRQEIEAEEQTNIKMVREYRSKKELVDTSDDRLKKLGSEIERYKQKIEEHFNPQAYRQYLRKMFSYQLKNQAFKKNIITMKKELDIIQRQASNIQDQHRSTHRGGKARQKTLSSFGSHREKIHRLKTEKSSKPYNLLTEKSELTTGIGRQSSLRLIE